MGDGIWIFPYKKIALLQSTNPLVSVVPTLHGLKGSFRLSPNHSPAGACPRLLKEIVHCGRGRDSPGTRRTYQRDDFVYDDDHDADDLRDLHSSPGRGVTWAVLALLVC